jgi:putative ABC transport system permease protein
VATPQLLEALGLPAQLASSPADLLTRHDEPTYLQLPEDQDEPAGAVDAVEVELPLLATVADDLLTPAAVERRGYDVRTVGWLGVAAQPLTDGQRAAALALVASRDGVDVELPLPPGSTEGFRTVAAIVGSLLGLAIMAVVVTLVRSESAAELRSLAAVGGSGRTRRSISAASAGLLALMGSVLALPGGYRAVVALEAEPNADYPFVVPWVSLGMLVVAVPVLAMGGAWLAGGREPETLLRTPLG